MPIAGDPLLVVALLLRVMAQLDDGSVATTAPASQCATIAGLRALSPAEPAICDRKPGSTQASTASCAQARCDRNRRDNGMP